MAGDVAYAHMYNGIPGEKHASKTPRPIRVTNRPGKLKAVAWKARVSERQGCRIKAQHTISVEHIPHPTAAVPNHSRGGNSFEIMVAGMGQMICNVLI